MSQSNKVSSYKSHPRDHRPISLTIKFPHLDQGIQEITVSSWSDVLIQFVSHGLSNMDLMLQIITKWRPIKNKPHLFRDSYREGYHQITAKLYMFEYNSARQIQACLDQLVDRLGLSHDCYEVALEPKIKEEKEPKMSIYAYKGVNGW